MTIHLIVLTIAAVTTVTSEVNRPQPPLDTSSINAVVISGQPSAIAVSTDTDLPFEAKLGGHRTGWFAAWYSTWFFGDCAGGASMRLDGSTLRIEVADSGWFDTSECVVDINANVPQGASVSVAQPAFKATLDGSFGHVALVGKAADIAIDGYAKDIEIRADAIRTRLHFDTVEQVEAVQIEGKALDADLHFGKDAVISYLVEATASFVDSALVSTSGATPLVTIKGDFVRATIR